jgi:hypothetical protein
MLVILNEASSPLKPKEGLNGAPVDDQEVVPISERLMGGL